MLRRELMPQLPPLIPNIVSVVWPSEKKKKKRRAIISLAQDTSGYGSNIHVAEQLPSLLVIHKHDEKLTLFLQATYAGISNSYLQANGIRVLSCHRHDIESTFQFYSYKIMRTLEYWGWSIISRILMWRHAPSVVIKPPRVHGELIATVALLQHPAHLRAPVPASSLRTKYPGLNWSGPLQHVCKEKKSST